MREINWEPLKDRITSFFFGNGRNKVVLSSIKLPEMTELYKIICKFENVLVLDELDSDEQGELDTDNTILVFDDSFKEELYCFSFKNRISVSNMYGILMKNYVEDMASGLTINNNPAILNVREVNNLNRFVELFDEGYQTICLEDDDNKYVGCVTKKKFAKSFPSDNYFISEECLTFTDDEMTLKKEAAKCMIDTEIDEVPVVRIGGGTQATVVKNGGINGQSYHDMKKTYLLHWEIFDEEDYNNIDLLSSGNILFSSNGGAMKNINKEIVKHDSFCKKTLRKYIKGDYDSVIYDAEIWPPGPARRINVCSLYADMLAKKVTDSLVSKGISYAYIDVGPDNVMQKHDDRMEYPYGSANHPEAMNEITKCKYFHPKNQKTNAVAGKNDVNISGGFRVTNGQPENCDKTVYMFGPCIVMGLSANDWETIPSLIQRKLNAAGYSVRVVNRGSFGTSYSEYTDINNINILMDTELKEGDIVIQFGQNLWKYNDIYCFGNYYRADEILLKSGNINKKIFYDAFIPHMNVEGYKILADFIFEDIIKAKCGNEIAVERKTIAPLWNQWKDKVTWNTNSELKIYVDELKCYRRKETEIGAVVMNCNPFTKGHRFLIDESLRQCEHLFVFVVEEDASDFAFNDRFEIVKENLKNEKRVTVLPSGKFMISSFTFAEYFDKDNKQTEKLDMTYDAKIFGEYIAPTLNISKRFVGEEPTDTVTRQYNESLNRTLSEFDVKLIEIPRIRLKGEVINATQVREELKMGDFTSAEKFLTPETMNYLRNNNNWIWRFLKCPHYDILKDKRYILYGTGVDSIKICVATKLCNAEVICFCNTNAEPDQYHLGYEVINFEQLKNRSNYDGVIIATSKYYFDIEKMLAESGLAEKIIKQI